MNFFTAIWSVFTGVGLAIVLGAVYLIIRGPFLGGAALAPKLLLVMVGVFVVGLVVLAFGGSKLARSLSGY